MKNLKYVKIKYHTCEHLMSQRWNQFKREEYLSLHTNENEHAKLIGENKSCHKSKFIVINTYIKKKENLNNLTLCSKELEIKNRRNEEIAIIEKQIIYTR